jgi:hypothetical protein
VIVIASDGLLHRFVVAKIVEIAKDGRKPFGFEWEATVSTSTSMLAFAGKVMC